MRVQSTFVGNPSSTAAGWPRRAFARAAPLPYTGPNQTLPKSNSLIRLGKIGEICNSKIYTIKSGAAVFETDNGEGEEEVDLAFRLQINRPHEFISPNSGSRLSRAATWYSGLYFSKRSLLELSGVTELGGVANRRPWWSFTYLTVLLMARSDRK